MPINKYKEIDLSKMRDMINIESAMFTPKIDDILGPDRLVKGEMLQCNYGIPAYNEMRGMHSTLAMAMALDSIKRCHNDTPIFHMPHEQVVFDRDTIYEKLNKPSYYNHDYIHMDSFTYDNDLLCRAGLFPDSDHWSTSVCRYDEEKVKAYKIPSNDRLDMLARIYKLIKGIKK